ncbi:MAG: septation protein IspZ [Candidatus Moraniibacteriota bacterium]
MLIEWIIQFGPITSFFLVFEASGWNFFAATAVLMATVVLATAASWYRSKQVAWFPLWSAGFSLVFGGATLYYADPQWLILKDTLYDGLFGLMLLFGLAFRKNLLRKFFMPLFAITDRGWHILAVRWALFFLVSATLNEVVRHWVTPEIWVHYKIANTVAFITFGLYQLRLTGRERLATEANRLGMRLTHYKK